MSRGGIFVLIVQNQRVTNSRRAANRRFKRCKSINKNSRASKDINKKLVKTELKLKVDVHAETGAKAGRTEQLKNPAKRRLNPTELQSKESTARLTCKKHSCGYARTVKSRIIIATLRA